jgi:acyl-CoA thioester hydrolase
VALLTELFNMTTDQSAQRALRTWSGTVAQDWVDYNGHLRDAYYLLIFSLAIDSLMDHIGLDEAGRNATGHSLFTMECHLNYLQEVKAGAAVEVYSQILGHDKKRLHISQTLHLKGLEPALAANEQMQLNVELANPKSAVFAPEVMANVQRLAAQHAQLPRPKYIGRVIALPASLAV